MPRESSWAQMGTPNVDLRIGKPKCIVRAARATVLRCVFTYHVFVADRVRAACSSFQG